MTYPRSIYVSLDCAKAPTDAGKAEMIRKVSVGSPVAVVL